MNFWQRLFRKAKLEHQLDAELRFHFDEQAAANLRAGMSEAEARRQARLQLGGMEQLKEDCRDARGTRWLESLWQDVRFAVRSLRRTPSFTAIALVSIALSVGATAVVFTAIKAVLLNPLPYKHVEGLVQLRSDHNIGGSHTDWVFWNDTQEIIRRTRTLESVGIYGNAVFDLGGGPGTPPEALYGLRVSASLFPTLGVSPMLGRNILPEEDQPGHVNEMILSYGLWTRRFNSDRNIIGQTVKVNGQDCIVIGVMPPDFNFPLRRGATRSPSSYVEFWAPLRIRPSATNGGLGAVARLRPGVSVVEAQQDLASISAALTREFPATNRDRTLRLSPLWDRTVRNVRPALWFLMAATMMFLLIGCANVANLLLARGLVRQREISIRTAIGAGRMRIIRQLLTESCVLAALGGTAGYLLTVFAWKILPAIAPVSIPRLASAQADWTIFAFAVTIALANGILFGIAPALRSAASAKSIALRTLGSRGAASGRQDRTRAALVIGEVAITVTLVLVGGQLLGNFIELLRTDPGFQADRVLASIVLPASERYKTPEERGRIYSRFLEAVRALPGVENAGTVDALPFSGENHGGFISANKAAPTERNNQLLAEVDVIGGEYLQTLGVRLIAGRWLREEEMKKSSDVAIINDLAARRLWPKDSAVGKQLCVDCTPESPNHWKRVIGVVSSIRHADLDAPPGPNVYLSAGALEQAAFLVVKTNRPSGEMDKAIRQAIAAIDPDQPVLLSATLQTLISDSIADRRFIMSLLTATACLALLMSLAGVYGVASYTTSRRTQEIGIRMALGATPRNVHALIFRQGFFSVAAGLAVGLLFTAVLMHVLRGTLVGLKQGNMATTWIAAGLVLLTAAVACYLPARRATKVEPTVALRHE